MRLVVLGSGESGVGAALLGLKHGYDVFVSDFGRIKKEYKDELIDHSVKWEEGKHSESEVLNATVVVKSPGIPDTVHIVVELKKRGIPVISEIEFAFGYTNAKIVGITGSNGKTTTTMLTYHLLKSGGLKVGVAGNIGKSFARQVVNENYEVYVLELSSFQLDGIVKFRPDIAIITNISPDHLDRYDYDYSKYVASKFRITMNQTASDSLIYDQNDVTIGEWLKNNKIQANRLPFSINEKVDQGAFIADKEIKIQINKDDFKMSTDMLSLKGKHNVKNAMAATTVAQLMRIRKQTIRESLTDFQGVEHRLEKVAKINEVLFVNDSKATNVNATFFALDSMESATVWIVGGVDKGNDYTDLMPLVREKVKAIVCLGMDNRKIIDFFGGVIDVVVESDTMGDAVKKAKMLSEEGDAVLLSPACASFDLFENYEDRGRQFKKCVNAL